MPASYPTTVKTFTAKTDNVDTVLAADVNLGYDEITAIETEVGTNPKAAALEARAATAAAVVNLLGQLKQGLKDVLGTTNWYDAAPATLGDMNKAVDIAITAGEALAARDCIYISTGGSETAGRAYKANANIALQSTRGFVFGFATGAVTAGSQGTARIAGILGGFTGLTPGVGQYVSTVAGGITETKPAAARLVGIPLSSANLLINSMGSQVEIGVAGTKGYFAGGWGAVNEVRADKVVFSNDTTAAQVSANLSQARRYLAGVGQKDVKAYFAGGYTSTQVSTADKLTYSNDTTVAQTSANLSQARPGLAGATEGNTKGYFVGGNVGSYVATADKLTYSNDTTVAQTSADLPVARNYLAGVSEMGLRGYFAGGDAPATTGKVDKLTFSNETMVYLPSAVLSLARHLLAGVSEGSIKAYFAGGSVGSTQYSTADKLTYSNDTIVAQVSANLSQARSDLAGLTEGNVKGYFAGGWGSNQDNVTADKLTYSNDTTVAQVSANLSFARSAPAGVGIVGW